MPHYTKDGIAKAFIDEGRRRGITPRGQVIAIATGLVESNLTVYANEKVPESLALPHDAVGRDGKSVGPLQQQVVMGNGWWWGDAATCMDPTKSVGLFYDRLVKLDYNGRNSPGSYAQAIQRSAYPDRYDQRMAEAQGIHDRLAGASPIPPPAPAQASTYGMPPGSNSGGYGNTGVRFPDWVYALGNAFGLKPSTYPGHQESDRVEAGYARNPQKLNRGIDWAAPGDPQEIEKLTRFADYLATIPTQLEQVIWQNPRTMRSIEVAGGRHQPGYFAADLAGHRNHVHTRQDHAIPLPGGAAPAPRPAPAQGWKGDPVWLPDVLRAEGLVCHVYPGALERGHGDMGQLWGVMCLEPGAIVLTERGLIPISDVIVGDRVWTHNQRWRQVTDTQVKAAAPRMRLRAQGVDIICTPDHCWLDDQGQWSPAADVFMVRNTTVRMPVDEPPRLPDGRPFSPEIAAVVGAWLADGTVVDEHHDPNGTRRSKTRLRINPGAHKANPVVEWLDSSGARWYRSADHANAATLDINDDAVTEFVLRHFGRGSAGKRLPAWLLASPKHCEALLDAYLHGDGHLNKSGAGRPHYSAGSVSRALAHGIVQLARISGRYAYLAQRREPGPGEIDGKSFERQEQFVVHIYDSPPTVWSHAPYVIGDDWVVLVDDREDVAADVTYDITVEEDHSFLADGVWSHNCHHTGSFGETPRGIAEHPSLGLASQLYLGRNGEYTLCGVGKAWHGGAGSYSGISDVNGQLIGIEAANDGGGTPGKPHRSSWPDVQYDAYIRGVAAILSKLGYGSERVIGHKEWAGKSQGKWDPGAIDMNIFRADVSARLATNTSPTQGEDELSAEAERKIDVIYQELTKQFKSRSPLRHLDEGYVETAVGFGLNNDSHGHLTRTIEEVRLGYPKSIELCREVAGAEGDSRYPDRQDDAKLAQAILADNVARPTVGTAAESADAVVPQWFRDGTERDMRQANDTIEHLKAELARLREENDRLSDTIANPPVSFFPAVINEPVVATTNAETFGDKIGRVHDSIADLHLADALSVEERAPIAATIAVLQTKNGSQL